jgi:hypothetical protein
MKKHTNLLKYGVYFWLFFFTQDAFSQYEIIYPYWFYHPPQDVRSAVGYTLAWNVSAYTDGYQRYWGQKKVKVFGTLKYYSTESVLDITDSIFLKPLWGAPDSLLTLAYYPLDHDSLLMVGSRATQALNDIVRAEDHPRPQWVTRLPAGDGYIYAVGAGRFQRGKHHLSWSVTDENAIVSCGKAVCVTLKNLVRDKTGSSTSNFENIISIDVEVILQDVQIISRWLDFNAKTCFSLCRARYIENGTLINIK